MRVSKGGTDMYCPACKQITTCKAWPAALITLNSKDYGQQWQYTRHKDINWFQRGRECLACGHDFITGEVDKEFLNELVELREALSSIKSNAETYIKESTAASLSLEKLSKSLGVLRALKVYKTVKE